MEASSGPSEMGRTPGGRKLIAVVYADMVGYSRLIGLDDIGTLERLRTLRRAVIDPAINEYSGRVVNTGGDSLLLVFDSIDGAVRCAVTVQQQVPAYDGGHPPDRTIRFRVGINIGDVIPDGTDVYGAVVNVAARLQAACPPGGICVSQAVRDHVRDRPDIAFDALGPIKLKNITHPVEAFVLRLGTSVPKAVHAPVSLPDLSLAKAPRLSLVVLPFANLSGNETEDYLAEFISEDLATDLSYLPGALVIARQSAATYKGKPVDVRRIGEELGVRYVIEGSVRKLGEMLRVNVQLISAETNTHVWAGHFDQNVKELGIGQEEIVSRLRAVLGIQVLDAESARGARERPDNPDASDFLFRGMSAWRKAGNPSQWAQAAALFEQTLHLDPLSVRAMCHLTYNLVDRFAASLTIQAEETRKCIDRAANLVSTAEAIEPDSRRVLQARGGLLRAQGNLPEAIAVHQRLIELYPNLPDLFLISDTRLPQIGRRSGGRGDPVAPAIDPIGPTLVIQPTFIPADRHCPVAAWSR